MRTLPRGTCNLHSEGSARLPGGQTELSTQPFFQFLPFPFDLKRASLGGNVDSGSCSLAEFTSAWAEVAPMTCCNPAALKADVSC